MARARVKLDKAGMRELLRSREVQTEMHRKAERAADAARTIAPEVSGDYIASIEPVDDPASDRARSRVVAHVPYALEVEARHRVLGRALDAAKG